MRRIDELFLAHPFLGSRRLATMLSGDDRVNRKRVQRLMRRMGIAALGPKPRTRSRRRDTGYSPICCAA
jgi:putative transposase